MENLVEISTRKGELFADFIHHVQIMQSWHCKNMDLLKVGISHIKE